MKKILAIAFCLCCFMPASAEASPTLGVYVAPKFVYSYVSTDISGLGTNDVSTDDDVFGVAVALGYDFDVAFDVPIRAELEWNMHSQSEKDHTYTIAGIGNTDVTNNIGIQSVFLNAYFDLHNSSKFTPYVGAGVGVSFVDVEATLNGGIDYTIEEKTTTNFAWNVGVGVAYAFTSNLSLDLSYRYSQFGKGETSRSAYYGTHMSAKTDTIGAHQGLFALRYTF